MFLYFLWVACARAGADNLREVELGDSCMARFDLFHALQHYEAALARRDDAGVRMRLAECHYRRHDYAKCIQVLKPVPDDSLSHEAMRRVYYSFKELGDQGSQEYWARTIVGRYPMDGEMVAELGTVYLLTNMVYKAIAVCTKYWLVDAHHAAVSGVLADAHFVNREFVMAGDLYAGLLAAGDSTYHVLFNLGVCHERLDRPEQARACFSEAIARSDSAIAGALYHQGAVLNALGEPTAAQACFEKALQVLTPDNLQMFVCYRGMAESHYARRQYREAAYAFHEALRYDATSLTSYYFLGICQEASGNRREAVRQFNTFLTMAAKVSEPTDSLKVMIDDARCRIK